MRPYILFLFLLLFLFHCRIPQPTVPEPESNQFLKNFQQIPSEGQRIQFNHSLPVNNQGGHLQGVQFLRKGQEEYAILSGSSSTYAYYATVKLGTQNKTVYLHKILDKPYKHAGGFQIYDDLMAIGVEDNDAKNRSKVFVYRLANPESSPGTPLAVIDRQGAVKRATAGCVAITKTGNQLLLIVGDWDSKHLDFYTSPYPTSDNPGLVFEKVFTIDTQKLDKSKWIDQAWHSYQNINLIKDEQEKLYLIGMAGNAKEQNVADLFLLEEHAQQKFSLTKLASKTFGISTKTKFRWGAGIVQTKDGKMGIVACGEHLHKESFLTFY